MQGEQSYTRDKRKSDLVIYLFIKSHSEGGVARTGARTGGKDRRGGKDRGGKIRRYSCILFLCHLETQDPHWIPQLTSSCPFRLFSSKLFIFACVTFFCLFSSCILLMQWASDREAIDSNCFSVSWKSHLSSHFLWGPFPNPTQLFSYAYGMVL